MPQLVSAHTQARGSLRTLRPGGSTYCLKPSVRTLRPGGLCALSGQGARRIATIFQCAHSGQGVCGHFQARGLDVLPQTVSRLRNGGDAESVRRCEYFFTFLSRLSLRRRRNSMCAHVVLRPVNLPGPVNSPYIATTKLNARTFGTQTCQFTWDQALA